ncbi:uncharacterized protein LACBIDRAFT_292561 [Laccaria bicolor S238N-H82]|uniref:Predicted protein n=1 Tax=Laccaria bicolor (strain S238N-H82 / ATCC MYA-4686) TaxID=486041 RepID=B0CVL9_LACBS|nr:uncharacterized protein LACBIDRAFT_292561 [Laccaria bicolor S238N-H82]EDR13768.1 predicted protein [Laccaria bicolor S238N-H82]|eukprot:XP_001876266.1 predicted protein [Laccaria bicolor S238N-H82]
MSTNSLPSYLSPSLNRVPSYSAEPHDYERRLALADRLRPRPSGSFVKESKNGDARLRLSAQEDNISLPIYGSRGVVEGTVELSKTDGIQSVEVKIEGRLKLREIAEGGTALARLCLDTALVWFRDDNNIMCPPSMPFALTLPSTFTFEDKTYPLPPTFDVKLEGLPGFTANIDYSVSATIVKSNAIPLRIKSKALNVNIGSGASNLTIPFTYLPRTRPAYPIPTQLFPTKNGFILTPEWRVYESVMVAKKSSGQNITTKLYLPASRIFCVGQPIPFHLTLESSAMSLADFLPYSPVVTVVGKPKATRLELTRQSTVDVRNVLKSGAKTDIWRVDCIGEGKFRHAGDGPTWISFTGEVTIKEGTIPGFRAAGLTVKDFILFTVNPHDPKKSSFRDLRQVIPVRLTTDTWTMNGAGVGVFPAFEYSVPSSPGDTEDHGSSANGHDER